MPAIGSPRATFREHAVAAPGGGAGAPRDVDLENPDEFPR